MTFFLPSEIDSEVTLLFYRAITHLSVSSPLSLSLASHEKHSNRLLCRLGLSDVDIMDVKQHMCAVLGMALPGGRSFFQTFTLFEFLKLFSTQFLGKSKLTSSAPIPRSVSQVSQETGNGSVDSISLDLEPIRIVAASLHLPETHTIHEFWDRTLNGDLYYRSVSTDTYDLGEQTIMEDLIVRNLPNVERGYLKMKGTDRKVSYGAISRMQMRVSGEEEGLDLLFHCSLNSILEVMTNIL